MKGDVTGGGGGGSSGGGGSGGSGSGGGSLEAYSFTAEKKMPFALVDRGTLSVGDTVDGPAIIGEATTTTYLDAGFRATVHKSGCLFIASTEA